MPHSLRHALGTFFLAGNVLLSGCSATSHLTPVATNVPAHATLILRPELSSTGSKRIQAVVPHLTVEDVDHVRVQLYTVTGNTFTPVKDANGPLTLRVPRSDLGRPVVLSQLHPQTHYQVAAWAFKAPDETEVNQISFETRLDVLIEADDRPTISSLPIQLNDVPFNGKAAFPTIDIHEGGYVPDGVESVTTAGMFWHLLATLLPMLSGTDEDRMSPRSAVPDGKPDARFRVSLDLPPGVPIRVISLYAVDAEGSYVPGKYWTTWDLDDPQDRLLGVAHDGQLLNTDFVSKFAPFQGPTDLDLYADSPGDFLPGQAYNIDVVLSNGTAVWNHFTLPTQQEVTP